MKRKKVVLLFGGKSAEHEISVISCRNIAKALDKSKYEALLVGISKEGSWYLAPTNVLDESLKSLSDRSVPSNFSEACLISHQEKPALFNIKTSERIPVDIAFPVLHGTYGEDGCIQGLFKMVNIPFVGCGVWASATGMDKEFMKRILKDAQIPTAKYLVLHKENPLSFSDCVTQLGLPFFIKPASAGSSVGVHKIKTEDDYHKCTADSFRFDYKVLAEKFIKGREIEVSVMGLSHCPKVSVPGEVIPTHEFYSYEAKYLDANGAHIKIPADLPAESIKKIQTIAAQTFTALNCDGLSRVDFFYTEDGEVMINEINTIPGFTSISMYPKMWEASGIQYTQLITELLGLAEEKFGRDNSLETSYS